MARSPTINYSSLGTGMLARAYRGDVMSLREELDEVYDGINQKKAGWKTVVAQTIREFSTAAGLTLTTATQVTVSNAQKVNAVSVIGTGNFATFTVSGGAITGIVLSAS